jgi:hypothetical protein
MTVADTQSMFESIKNSLNRAEKSGNYKNILKVNIDKSILVRFAANPNINPIQTFFHYYHHIWESRATGEFVSALCPTTNGDRCPLCEARFKLYKSKSDSDKEIAALLNRKENWLVNCYIINDQVTPENNGTIKMLRFGKQIQNIINQAVEGDDASEIGANAIFDLTEKGSNFRVKVDKNEGGYPTYIFSKFLNKGPIEGMTPQKIKDIYEKQVFDLTTIFPFVTKEELKKMLNVHIYCLNENGEKINEMPKSEPVEPVAHVAPTSEPEDHLPGLDPKTEPKMVIADNNVITNLDDLIKDL